MNTYGRTTLLNGLLSLFSYAVFYPPPPSILPLSLSLAVKNFNFHIHDLHTHDVRVYLHRILFGSCDHMKATFFCVQEIRDLC